MYLKLKVKFGGLPQGFRKLPDANVTLDASDSGKAIIVVDNWCR